MEFDLLFFKLQMILPKLQNDLFVKSLREKNDLILAKTFEI